MGQVDLPEVQPKGNKSTDEYVRYMADIIAILKDEIENILNGRLSSNNIREIAGYNVDQTELKHKSGIVGMSGADPTNPEAIRFYAGDSIDGNPTFAVTQGGLAKLINIILQTSDAYPRVELSSALNMLALFKDANTFVKLTPNDPTTSVPTFEFSNGINSLLMFLTNISFNIAAQHGDLVLQSYGSDVYLTPGTGKDAILPDWDNIVNNITGQTLQLVLDGINNQISGLTSRMAQVEGDINDLDSRVTALENP